MLRLHFVVDIPTPCRLLVRHRRRRLWGEHAKLGNCSSDWNSDVFTPLTCIHAHLHFHEQEHIPSQVCGSVHMFSLPSSLGSVHVFLRRAALLLLSKSTLSTLLPLYFVLLAQYPSSAFRPVSMPRLSGDAIAIFGVEGISVMAL